MSARIDSVKLSLPLRWVSYQNGVESYSEDEADKDHDEQDIKTNLQTTGVRGASVSTNRRLGAQVLSETSSEGNSLKLRLTHNASSYPIDIVSQATENMKMHKYHQRLIKDLWSSNIQALCCIRNLMNEVKQTILANISSPKRFCLFLQ